MKLVICEGKDDEAVIKGLCQSAGIAGLQIERCEGRGGLAKVVEYVTIRPEFARREVESVAIVIDAENNEEASWAMLKDAVFKGFGLSLERHEEFIGDAPKVAGFVVSDGTGKGMIENLCLASVQDQPEYACLEQYFACLAERTEKKEYHPKSWFRAWMACYTGHDLPVREAVKEGFFDWNKPAFDGLREFLRRV